MLSGQDIAQLKAYVAAPASGIQHRLDSTVLLSVSHSNLTSRFMEIRLDLHVSFPPIMCSRCMVTPRGPASSSECRKVK